MLLYCNSVALANGSVAAILLERAELPDWEKIIVETATPLMRQNISRLQIRDGVAYLPVGKGQLVAALAHSAIPADELHSVCRYAKPRLGMACVVAPNHKAHLLFSLSGTGADRLDEALLLTRVIASAIRLLNSNAVAVYWGRSLRLPSQFTLFAGGASRIRPPLMLWIAFIEKTESNGQRSFCTSGMRAFGIFEIEAVVNSWNLSKRASAVADLATLLIRSGSIVMSGSTLKFSAGGDIRVDVSDSNCNPGQRVYRLRF